MAEQMVEETTGGAIKDEKKSELTLEEAMDYVAQLSQQGRHDQALQLCRKAYRDIPDSPLILNVLGVLHSEQDDFVEASLAFEKAISMEPTVVERYQNLGNSYFGLGWFNRAEAVYRDGLKIAPDNADILLALAKLLVRKKENDDAEKMFRKVLELDETKVFAAISLCQLLHRSGRAQEAAEFARKWRALSPDDPSAQHIFAAMTGENPPERANDGYVKRMFDIGSSDFDNSLANLKYRAPDLARAIIEDNFEKDSELAVLDAGCGTGLCGPFLQAYKKRLVGIDLSEGMLEKARQRGLYDDLQEVELVSYLMATDEQFDLVISTDTLVYFGEIGKALAGMARVLVPGGRVIFTVEHLRNEGEDFHLHSHGRYSHSLDYVQHCLGQAGFGDARIDQDWLRTEGGEKVQGLVVTAVRA